MWLHANSEIKDIRCVIKNTILEIIIDIIGLNKTIWRCQIKDLNKTIHPLRTKTGKKRERYFLIPEFRGNTGKNPDSACRIVFSVMCHLVLSSYPAVSCPRDV